MVVWNFTFWAIPVAREYCIGQHGDMVMSLVVWHGLPHPPHSLVTHHAKWHFNPSFFLLVWVGENSSTMWSQLQFSTNMLFTWHMSSLIINMHKNPECYILNSVISTSIISQNPRERRFAVQISLLIVTFLSLISRSLSLMQATKEVNIHTRIAPCVNMWSVFFFLCHLLNVGACICHIGQEGQVEWTTLTEVRG